MKHEESLGYLAFARYAIPLPSFIYLQAYNQSIYLLLSIGPVKESRVKDFRVPDQFVCGL